MYQKLRLLILIIIFIPFYCHSQPRLAVVINESDEMYLNTATLTYATLKANGDAWYEENILKNIITGNRRNIAYALVVDNCGDMKIIPRKSRSPEVTKGLYAAIDYIKKHHLPIYRTSVKFAVLFLDDRKISAEEVVEAIRSDYRSPFTSLVNGWIPTWGRAYDSYREEEIINAREPLSYLDWIKQQIDYYFTLPIKSSLDYGITNEVFCPGFIITPVWYP